MPTPEPSQQNNKQELDKSADDPKTVDKSEDYFTMDENNSDTTIDFSLQVPNNTL